MERCPWQREAPTLFRKMLFGLLGGGSVSPWVSSRTAKVKVIRAILFCVQKSKSSQLEQTNCFLNFKGFLMFPSQTRSLDFVILDWQNKRGEKMYNWEHTPSAWRHERAKRRERPHQRFLLEGHGKETRKRTAASLLNTQTFSKVALTLTTKQDS